MENEAAQIVPIQPTTTVDPNAAPADQGTPTTPAGLTDNQQGGNTPVPGTDSGSPGPSNIPDAGNTQPEIPSDTTPKTVSHPEPTNVLPTTDGNISASTPSITAVLSDSPATVDGSAPTPALDTNTPAGGLPAETPTIPATAKYTKPRATAKPRTFFQKTETPANVSSTGGASNGGSFWRRLRPAHYIAGAIVITAMGAGIFVSTPTRVGETIKIDITPTPVASMSATLSPSLSPTLSPRRATYYPTAGVTSSVLRAHLQPSPTP